MLRLMLVREEHQPPLSRCLIFKITETMQMLRQGRRPQEENGGEDIAETMGWKLEMIKVWDWTLGLYQNPVL